MVRVHPSVCGSLEELLSQCGCITLLEPPECVYRRYEIRVGEYPDLWAQCHQRTSLGAHAFQPGGEIEKNWAMFRGLTNPAALPPQVVFGFEIMGSRLRFLPRLEKSKLSPEHQQAESFTMRQPGCLL